MTPVGLLRRSQDSLCETTQLLYSTIGERWRYGFVRMFLLSTISSEVMRSHDASKRWSIMEHAQWGSWVHSVRGRLASSNGLLRQSKTSERSRSLLCLSACIAAGALRIRHRLSTRCWQMRSNRLDSASILFTSVLCLKRTVRLSPLVESGSTTCRS